jgi:hypothetical protein
MFKIWEEPLVNSVLKHAIQIKQNIEHLAIDSQTQPYDMPPSLVPSDMLYNLAICYFALYEEILARDLVANGNPKTIYNNLQ